MSKGKRYKKEEKRFTNFLALYLIIVAFTFGNYTFSRYIATTDSASTIDIAKFNVKVNEESLNGQSNTFNLLLNSVDNTFNNKIVPDSEGYFEIVINPAETKVSLEYEIFFDLTNIHNENKNIILTKYSLDNGNTFTAIPTDNKIVGEMNLPNNTIGFTEENILTIRVYWEWTQDITNPTFENTAIQVTSIIKQKV